MAREDKGREAFLEEAGRRYDEMMSRAGPASGDTFDDIEEQAEAAGKALIGRMLRDRMVGEAAAEPEEVACPKCGRPMRVVKAEAPRNLETASGVVGYARSHRACDRCEASFSPSGRAPEDSRAGSVGAAAKKGVRGESGRIV
jgi:hypothetical protein